MSAGPGVVGRQRGALAPARRPVTRILCAAVLASLALATGAACGGPPTDPGRPAATAAPATGPAPGGGTPAGSSSAPASPATSATGVPHGTALPADPGYALAATVSPAPMTRAGCAADPRCVAAPAPVAGDNHRALRRAVATAASRAVPAVVDRSGAVVTPARPGTVLLAPGTYRLGSSLGLPPNVDLRGRGITATTLAMITSKWANFTHRYLVHAEDQASPGSANLVADLTVNGNCREGAGAPTPADLPARPARPCDFRARRGADTNVGGGVSVGDRWTVRQVRFTNLEYFKLWVHGTTGVHIVDNRFDNWGGAESGDEDNIGGGGRNDGTVIEHNQFDSTVRGNSVDFTNAVRTAIRANAVYTDPAVAAARHMEYGNLYLEGVPKATIEDNLMYGGHITLRSNSKYAHAGPNKDITNPRDTVVRGNRLIDSTDAAVIVMYDDYRDADGSSGSLGPWGRHSTAPGDHVVRAGGANVIADNTIVNPRNTAIVIAGTMNRVKNAPDTVTGNDIRNPGSGGATEMNTGAGIFDTSGIGISIGDGDKIYGNAVTDDRPRAVTRHGVQVGARSPASTVRHTVLTGPAGETNTTSGITGKPVLFAAP
ncbi:hypothetical protein [Krasilnikovia sp. M28-CT-15]|uniref:hypothetical protein n=1 Tax=Krasilnikovia sp. M28-CT-15 TaxID=3373540 RepID=UPI003875E2F0